MTWNFTCLKKLSTAALLLFSASVFAQQPGDVPLKWLYGSPKKATGTSWGVPWPQGQVKKNTEFALTKPDGSKLPVQSWTMATWPDGSVKWTGLAAVGDSTTKDLALSIGSPKNKPGVAKALQVNDDGKTVTVNTGAVQCVIAKSGTDIVPSLSINGKQVATDGVLQCLLQNKPDVDWDNAPARQRFMGDVKQVTVEQNGPLRAVVRVNGNFKLTNGSRSFMPFILRFYFYEGVSNIRLLHTIIYDGDDQKDFIKGLGLTFNVPLREQLQNHHVRFSGEGDGIWAEPVQPLNGRRPSPNALDQANGRKIPNVEEAPNQKILYDNMASWNDYKLVQSSADGFNIQKRTNNAASWLDVIGGKRATGMAFVGDATGGLSLSLKNFWQSYPAALEIFGARTKQAKINVWMWSPYAEAMDLRHYDTTAHDLNVTYEDVQPGFSTPYGVGRTSEVLISVYDAMPTNQQLADNVTEANNTNLLVTTPEYLHKAGAFGIWSLPDRSTKGKQWIEDQLDKAIAFYQQEIDHREWYGFWNYGDVMHSYDAARHTWKYDMGGFAWDNTELGTDIWLWYSYLRSGRADIFKMAEAMTRHTSEVDCYHLGRMAGLGSRHNVNHWGDGSKEVRESQAMLRRYYYYLTTDERTGDMMHETAMNADSGILHVDPLRELLPPSQYPTHARFGPDWDGLVGNWMTEWERTGDIKWKNKILVGVGDFAKMKYGFYSGNGKDGGMGYDPKTNHMYQLHDGDIGSLHLATLMGGMEAFYELTPLLNNKDFNRLYLQYCSLYGAPKEEVQAALGPEVKITLGETAGDYARQPAYVYYITKDVKYAKRAWDQFLPNGQGRPGMPVGMGRGNGSGKFDSQPLSGPSVIKPLNEIRNVSTNSTSQWCLNAIELLALAGDQLPEHNAAWDK
ncbi:Tat pathway signal sequence domain protein [Mucilaginibacter mali]|uniref:Tat pathway signal sequence domain protein n=1 Tax=Mucilaginibacter mali TaxID=2740462 RepID=A0A7D4UAS5_9SPHI|nr:Tat pathway signal sequence domain protein [Mucilaginibacter mali]QKJ30238.1 Tat pathway signal sequence domain protein [Mucilaginibacter mali]